MREDSALYEMVYVHATELQSYHLAVSLDYRVLTHVYTLCDCRSRKA